jgi:hypothetical protein
LLTELLPKTPRAPRDFKAPVAPNNWQVQTIASRLLTTFISGDNSGRRCTLDATHDR